MAALSLLLLHITGALLLFFFFTTVTGNLCSNTLSGVPATHYLRADLHPSDDTTTPAGVQVQNHALSSLWNLSVAWLLREGGIGPDGGRGGGKGVFLKEISLHDVRLKTGSVHGAAQQTNLEYLLELDVDRLVWSFRKEAGVPAVGVPYGGWEAPDGELRGHFVGHYMSATAMMWASTHNDTLRDKMDAIVSALHECQQKIGTGYLAAFPTEFFDRYEALKYVWAPYYTIHKIMAGLLDQYKFAGNSKALKMVVWMAEYFGNRVMNVINRYTIARHWAAMNEETGGMNDVLYNLYIVTGDKKHLILAHLFDKPCFLGPLALQDDTLSGFHANTHIPIAVGAQMRYEITGDPLYEEIVTEFMNLVNSSHTYATGGTSQNEHWTDPRRLASTLSTNNEESCTTYNMLKVSRNLFRWRKELAYADYYERALTNGVLSIQRGREPGVMIYFLPMIPGGSKATGSKGWGTKNNSFWCCYGTGIESFSKIGDSIFFEEVDTVPQLYVIQFISSSLNWKSAQIILDQDVKELTSMDRYIEISYTITTNKISSSPQSTINIRVPFWTSSDEAKVTFNKQKIDVPVKGGFFSITREWVSGDKIIIWFPIAPRVESIQDDRPENASTKAILFGPYLLAGLTNGEWDIKPEHPENISDWINPVNQDDGYHLVSLTQEGVHGNLFLSSIKGSSEDSEPTLIMKNPPNIVNEATFKLVLLNNTMRTPSLNRRDIIGENIVLELFDHPKRFVRHNGPRNGFSTIFTPSYEKSSMFKVVAGLDGNSSSISLESEDKPNCFLSSTAGSTRLICQRHVLSDYKDFQKEASFVLRKGLAEHHPISFIAKGRRRDFQLQPLMSLMDEHYTIYFRI